MDFLLVKVLDIDAYVSAKLVPPHGIKAFRLPAGDEEIISVSFIALQKQNRTELVLQRVAIFPSLGRGQKEFHAHKMLGEIYREAPLLARCAHDVPSQRLLTRHENCPVVGISV